MMRRAGSASAFAALVLLVLFQRLSFHWAPDTMGQAMAQILRELVSGCG